ncbi:MAG: serine/threonine-protein kinase [Acidobacteriota bacterium]
MTDRAPISRAREIFPDLADLAPADAEARIARLEGDDPDLARALRKLLAADRAAGDFLDGGAAGFAPDLLENLSAASAPPVEDRVGSTVGPWRLVSVLGRGGMGEVYRAERADGEFEQRVALKLLRPGAASDSLRRRFLQERQVLARLEHPNIARLLDGGTDDGRPYFVLELVEGKPIDEYCRDHRLSIDERLRLVIVCCDAVASAHRRLVVHRDLKPSNILVTEDGDVKLLDFGIAKLLAAEEDGSVTRVEERVLTPDYASPEQILGESVTTATDVYGLGLVLYELVTGSLPHDRSSGAADALAAHVERETVERASRAVAKARPEHLAAVGLDGQDLGRLSSRLEGDLDAALATALRREPERRYASASAFADDLRRYLAGKPVAARPDTVGYRFGKFVRRHRGGVAAAALLLAALLAGLAGTTWQARRAEANAQKALASARDAEAQALRARRVQEFLIGLFQVADPDQSGGETVTAKSLVDQAGRRLQTELSAEPRVQADLLEAVSRIERSLGNLDPARQYAEKAVAIRRAQSPRDDAAISSGLGAAGSALTGQGKLDEAEKILREALVGVEKHEARDALAAARVRADLSQVLFLKGRLDEAEKLQRRSYEAYRKELGADNVLTAIRLRDLGVILEDLDRLEESERAHRGSQAILEQKLGPDHVTLAESYLNLAVLLDRRGRADEAEPLYRRAIELRRRSLGPSHLAVAEALQLHAIFLRTQRRLDESEAQYQEALGIFRAIDPKHLGVGKCLNGIALIAADRGRSAEAETRFRELVRFFDEVLGPTHHFTWMIRGNLAYQIAAQGRLAEAEAIQREVVEKLEGVTGKESGETAEALERLGETLRRRGALDESVAVGRRALATEKKIGGEGHPGFGSASFQLGAALARRPDADSRREAREHLDRAAAVYRKSNPNHPRLPEVLLASGRLAAETGDRDRARRDLEESIALGGRIFRPSDPRIAEARRELSSVAGRGGRS